VILVAGGQLDPNIGTLLRRILERGVPFRDLLVGDDLTPRITIDLETGALLLEDVEIRPTACFIRHDVFLHQKTGSSVDYTAALNWFYALRGWSLSQSGVRLFNRHSYLSENNKIENLRLATSVGLDIPQTLVTNEFTSGPDDQENWIQKPIAGGAYTTLLGDFLTEACAKEKAYPRFVQRRMQRPELRIYRVGPSLFGFRLTSPDLDYRTNQNTTIEAAEIPQQIVSALVSLCDKLGLDFGAADFMQDKDGRLRFLEINSQPMFAAFDRIVRGKSSDAIIDYLTVNSDVENSNDAGTQSISL